MSNAECKSAGAQEPHLRNHTFVPPAPAYFQGAGISMAILTGWLIGILVLAIVAFLLPLDDGDKDKQSKL
jgi:hypothetical protein